MATRSGAQRRIVRSIAQYTALAAVASCALFPVLWGLSGSLKTDAEVTEPILFPEHPQWSNYREVFALMPFWRMFANTVLYAGCVTIGQVFFVPWPVMRSPACSFGDVTHCSCCTWEP